MPGHADHQTAVVTEVRRPPLLRVRHQGSEILDHRIQVEALELLGVVEAFSHRIGHVGIAVQNRNVQRVRPPVAVGASAATGERTFPRAFVSFCVHVSLLSCPGCRRAVPDGTECFDRREPYRRDSGCRPRCRFEPEAADVAFTVGGLSLSNRLREADGHRRLATASGSIRPCVGPGDWIASRRGVSACPPWGSPFSCGYDFAWLCVPQNCSRSKIRSNRIV